MAAHDERQPAPPQVARYAALIRVSEALRAYHDRESLFRSLARELRQVVHFHFLGLALRDERGVVRPYVLESTGEPGPRPELTSDDQLTHWVLRHQAPLIIDAVAESTGFAQEVAYLRDQQQTASICCLPLITPQRPVGMLLAGSRQPHQYAGDDVAFLSLVANQVALAIDDAVHFDALQAALALERDRQRDLEASDALLRTLSPAADIRPIFPRISRIASTVVPHDRLTLTLHDPDGDIALVAASDDTTPLPTRVAPAHGPAADDSSFIVEEIAAGRLQVQPAGGLAQMQAAGYRSVLGLHLTASDQRLGLHFWSREAAAFAPRHVPIARRIADHVALALSQQRLAEEARRHTDARERAAALERRVTALTAEVDALGGHRRMVGTAGPWKAAVRQATQVAATDTTVLLIGESGTGKEVVARFIHRASARSGGPFVAINCAALPEQLLESELFGYERGAFTGAVQAKPGHIEQAAGGVLFLDEVGEMSAQAQAKLLRVLQEREFQRLGGTRTLRADVRIVAATNRPLRLAIERGTFREDLYYRLNVFEIRLPPLRERREDILPLSDALLADIGRTIGRPPGGIAVEAREGLLAHRWPGNVRELRNVLERAAILCEGGLITTEHLTFLTGDDRHESRPATAAAAGMPNDNADLRLIEKSMIERALTDARHNKSLTAKRLGLTRKQLYVRLRQHGLA